MMGLLNEVRRFLGLRPVLVIYKQRGNETSEFVHPIIKQHAEAAGYQVWTRRL
jgi:hypothetical protein